MPKGDAPESPEAERSLLDVLRSWQRHGRAKDYYEFKNRVKGADLDSRRLLALDKNLPRIVLLEHSIELLCWERDGRFASTESFTSFTAAADFLLAEEEKS